MELFLRKNRGCINLVIFILIGIFISQFNQGVFATNYTNGIVTEMGVRLRSNPETSDNSNVIAYMSTGNKVVIHDQTYSDGMTWYYVTFNDKKGYAAAQFIQKIDDSSVVDKYPNENLYDYTNSTKNEGIIWNFLKNKGLNDYAIAGLMGNLKSESGLISINMENRGENNIGLTGKPYNDYTYTKDVDNEVYPNFVNDAIGYGLAQWTYYTRKANLLNFSRSRNTSVGNLNTQLEFLWIELNNNFRGVLNDLLNAKSVKNASDSVLINFENPADSSDSVKRYRAKLGVDILSRYSNLVEPEDEIIDDNPIPEPQPEETYPRWENDKYLKAKYSYAQNEWILDNGNWYYFKSDKCVQTSSWLEYKNEWYYFNSDGKMAKNEWIDGYYFKDSGACAKNEWIYDNSKLSWFYIKSDWKTQSNSWLQDKGKWYYLKDRGYMAVNEWLDGYYFKGDGSCAQGEWIYDNSKLSWFYFKSDWKALSNSWFQDKGKWYYLKNYGYMAVNEWFQYNGEWYYLKANGEMARNEMIDSYFVNSDGVWVK